MSDGASGCLSSTWSAQPPRKIVECCDLNSAKPKEWVEGSQEVTLTAVGPATRTAGFESDQVSSGRQSYMGYPEQVSQLDQWDS